jgi:lysophospholipase L1-like esterase
MSMNDNVIEFRPSADFTMVDEGVRDVGLVFLGDSLVAGVGDPKGQGWVTRVVGRTQHPRSAR